MLPLGERKTDTRGQGAGVATFLKADGLTSHRASPLGKQEEEGVAS